MRVATRLSRWATKLLAKVGRLMRRRLFLRDVRKAESEYASGRARSFDEVDAIVAELAD